MKKVLYFFPIHSSFIESDFQLLVKHYTVKSYFFKSFHKALTPVYLLHQFIFILLRLHSSSIFISQFSGYHSFLPSLLGRLFHRPHYIILHGTECNNFPEYHYGYISRPLLNWFSKKSLAWSKKLLPVSEALVRSDYSYTEATYLKQGFKAFYKDLNTPFDVIYNGISAANFAIDPDAQRKSNSFITVATGFDSSNRRIIKGIDLVLELAKATPEYHYTLLGANDPAGMDIPGNITMIGYVPNIELAGYYNRSMFYLQLSVSEGFGISVGEAMLCGCIPIVSNVGILPAIAGPDGYVLPEKNISLLLAVVNQAIAQYDPNDALRVRNHIVTHFSLEEREKKLIHAIGE